MILARILTVCGAALGLLITAGCGEKYPKLATVPAEGKVLYKDKPPLGAQITLVPKKDESPDAVRPRGIVGEEGVYRLTTYSNPDGSPDGAPPGEYLVSIRWTTRDQKSTTVEDDDTAPPGPPGGIQNDRFRDKYSNPKTSGLSLTVEAGKPLETIILK